MGQQTSNIAVAGQPKQVIAGLGISRRMDLDAVLDLFYGRTDVGDDAPSVVERVERIRRGSVQTIGRAGSTSRITWILPEPASAELTVDEAIKRFVEVAGSAVARELNDVSAIALSGGIDSTTVAAFAGESEHHPLAISAIYPHAPSDDESEYIAMMSAHSGLELETYVPGYRPHTELDRWVDLCDMPLVGPSLPAIAELLTTA
jgi:asparagine synthetase B (glutamine-hydrolysing)